jgi:uncharacterized protein
MSWIRRRALKSSVATLFVASMAAGATFGFSADARAITQPAPGKMLLFGSSTMNGALGHLMAADFEQLGFEVTRKGISSAGLARPDFKDIPQILGGFPIRRTATSVVLYIGGNDAQSIWLRPEERTAEDVKPWVFWKDERWPGIYETRMNKLLKSLCDRGVQHAFVLPPADVTLPRLQTRLERVRKIQQRAVKASQCGRFISTAGDHGNFELDGQPLRAPDGVHMNRAGASLMWTRIRERMFSLLGHEPPVQDCERCVSTRAQRRATREATQRHRSEQKSAGRGRSITASR